MAAGDLKSFLTFLRSIWGSLATAAILFPGAAALVKLPVAPSKSVIAPFYIWVAMVLGAFSVLLLASYRDNLGLQTARRFAVLAMVCSVVLFFGYITVWVFILSREDASQTIVIRNGERRLVKRDRSGGLIRVYDSPIPKFDERGNAIFPGELGNVTESVFGDPWDIASLACFTLTIAGLATGFGALGVYEYRRNSAPRAILEVPPGSAG